MTAGFEILGILSNIETIAVGHGIRDLRRLCRIYGEGRWRKLKGAAEVRLDDGSVIRAELHWYEMSSVGRREMKIKRFIR